MSPTTKLDRKKDDLSRPPAILRQEGMSIGGPPPRFDPALNALLFEIHTALNLETFWRATQRLLQRVLPLHSCSLLYGIVNDQPKAGRHFVADPSKDYQPASSLTVAGKYLAQHPQIKLYTFSQVVTEDPEARRRRLEQEKGILTEWTEFVHLAFWDNSRPDAVLSIRRQGDFTETQLQLLEWLYPMIDAALYRLRALESVRNKHLGLEQFITDLPVAVLFLDFDFRLTYASTEGYEAAAAWTLGSHTAKVINPRRVFRLPVEISRACQQLGHASVAADGSHGVVNLGGKRVPHPTVPGFVARVVLSQPVRSVWSKPGFVVTFSMERNLDGAALVEDRVALKHLQILSRSERRVALLVAEGLGNQAISEQLGKSVRTVECQLNAIYRKLDLTSRVQLARLLA